MMSQRMNPQRSRLLKVVRWIGIAGLILAICFRFLHLDRKVYWHDEVYTSLVITAHPGRYLTKDLFTGKIVQAKDLLTYQHFAPSLTLQDMLVRKGLEDAQHPPLYYLLIYAGAKLGGTSIAFIRGLSAFLSLAIFPALYWLCLELFGSAVYGWVAIGVFAVSPVHLIYAQEARQYGLWTALVLVSSALLLKAIRSSSWQSWGLYALSMLVASYTSLFTLGIAISHCFYILWVDCVAGNAEPLRSQSGGVGRSFTFQQLLAFKQRLTWKPLNWKEWLDGRNRTIACLVSLIGVGVLFTPWLYFMVVSKDTLHQTTNWIGLPLPWISSLELFIANFSRIFIDFNFGFNNPWIYICAIPFLSLQLYSLFDLYRTSSKAVWGFVVTLIAGTILLLGLPDLLLGGQRVTVNRYLIPCFVGIQLAVAYCCTHLLLKTWAVSLQWKRGLVIAGCIGLMAAGVGSCGVYSQANTWWNKVVNSNYAQIAEILNRSDRPLVVTDGDIYNPASMVSLSYLLNPTIHFWLLPKVSDTFPDRGVPEGFQSLFMMNLSEQFRHRFEATYPWQGHLVFQDEWNQVWQLKPKPVAPSQ
ncbi:glycosyltransferase family 39 protein [Alkalinema sp. FACHB-956]|uniref:glycosyltransferase family 39 protein n=1 Tax=Alkalinema sp. FACHB-956 TaxID=2692768 RepID=UPI0016898B96|nr:glycosyltransferase family 39 protein [Alkalinema sp. FACHB-956]MBD2328645.1 glycosyltransferase family 39 protein [Alkalinema sp. FACHB-956]